ncbi:virulence factor TspB C-terminal domain-related protein [Acinetobacter lactucae]|uniref:virulence factor TspB C-terminal domain-related protein n=1 Tax=Acinetobacter lactucae TaxID=1785128 RepID=UPI001580FB64|nr:virulence factor TspB C-terminal domain-related protein [Acinetobacter lactucae]NUF38924.1 hypothetical protein [Acinetobacter lactucae]
MAINDDLYWYKNVLKRTISTTIRFYLSISIILSPIILMTEANATDKGDWWLQREVKLQQNREDYARRVYGRSAKSFTETDPVTAKSKTVTKIAIAEATPTASRVGSTMLQRVAFYAKNPGVQMIGVYAVTQLIEGIGWVMDEGSKSYVKYKPTNQSCQTLVYAMNGGINNTSACTVRDSCLLEVEYLKKQFPARKYAFKSSTENPRDCTFTWVDGTGATQTGSTSFTPYTNPNYDPNAQKEKIPLTPVLLGAAMMGEGYNDPVDPTRYNPMANTGQMDQSVANAYEHDPTGVGDDLALEMDDKIKNAPLTPDGQPAPFGDPRYKTAPTTDNPNMNDRAWQDDGAKADGKAEPIKDADGNPTGGQSISLEFPVFCEWAFTVCNWYDDWQTTDKWLKEDPEQKDPEKVEFDDDASAGKVTLTGSDVCPQDSVQFTVMGQLYTIELPYQPVCDALTFFKPAVLAVGAITSAFIVAGINVKGEE